MSRRHLDDMDAFKADRDSREQDDAWLIEEALRDIRAGRLDTESIHLALKLGHHPDYAKLKQAHVDAIWAARQAGAQ